MPTAWTESWRQGGGEGTTGKTRLCPPSQVVEAPREAGEGREIGAGVEIGKANVEKCLCGA